jgi:8-oxo-(d)GTP phosphatase
MTTRTAADVRQGVVEAAGAVVWRPPVSESPAAHDRAEVLLVHRPRYDDWSFPKGKLLTGEPAPAAAVREVYEESGIRIRLGLPLPAVRYQLAGGAEKLVRYWAAQPLGPLDRDDPPFEPNREVDRRGWFGLREAAHQLTHARDRALLGKLPLLQTRTLIVLRHGEAVKRDRWEGPDAERPLTEAGVAQAERLASVLDAYAIRRLVTSDARRCVDTLRPYAVRHALEVEVDPAFAEEVDPAVVREHAVPLLDTAEPTVLCTHRPTLPVVFEALGVSADDLRLRPADLVVAHLGPQPRQAPVALELQSDT